MFLLAIVGIVLAVAFPLIIRLRESHPTVALILSVIAFVALGVATVYATIERAQYYGWKDGLTIPIVVILSFGIGIVAFMVKHKDSVEYKTENKKLIATEKSTP